ncbi:hypothetical protein NLI96_g9646 [Meripilus lineatus]|uniref:Uncharacterized protein n=1 Tax=Meripilus lineatus TaxID=2056292 RepID=A0AAD5UZH7_9APHY|nr:hypothetical protein NLI96_g9646 [Physisporinus lineatus]
MDLDNFEEAQKVYPSQRSTRPPFLQSVRWGEFLCTMEECDHWSLRGAGGLECSVELSTSVSDLDAVLMDSDDAWSLGDWARFVKAWKREEKKSKASVPRPAPRPSPQPADSPLFADDVAKASTDKLSGVSDWIVAQVPSRSPPPQQ